MPVRTSGTACAIGEASLTQTVCGQGGGHVAFRREERMRDG